MDTLPTILVIEDSPVVQHVVRATLAPIGAELIVAADGETGLELARTMVPDLITLDIGLPGINGWQVLRELRRDPDTMDIGVVVLTAHVQESMKLIAVERGADDFLGKPFRPDDLRACVAPLLTQPLAYRLAVGS